jgi:hypothetical protein
VGAPVRPPTTFRAATGEMSSINETLAGGPEALRAKSRRGLVIGGASAAVVIAVVVAVAATRGPKTPDGAAAIAPPVAPTATAPAATATPPPAPKPVPREAPTPAAQILVRLSSEPPGALVTDARRGVVIGATPFEQRLDRKTDKLGVRLSKDGFANVDLEIPLGADFEKAVHLERLKAHAPAAHQSTKKPTGPAAGPAPKVATAPSTAPPPATTLPPAAPKPVPAAKPKAEKW